MGKEEEIRLIAYSIWEEEGCPDGRDCEHWYRAEAIWEERRKPKTVVKSIQAKPQPEIKPKTKVEAMKKKSPRT